MKNIYFCNIDFGKSLTGIEHASLKRAILFEKYFNLSPIFLTAKCNLNLQDNWDKLKKTGNLSRHIQYINIYEMLMESEDATEAYQIENKNEWDIKEMSETGQRYYNKKNKNFNMYVIWQDKLRKKISYINYFLNGERIYRNKFDQDGRLAITQYLKMDNKIEKIQKEIFYKKNGKICLVKKRLDKSEEFEIYDDYGCLINIFNSENDFIKNWLETIVEENDLFIIDKNKTWSNPLMKLKKEKNINLITTFHSLHVKKIDQLEEGKINSNYQYTLSPDSNIDTYICLTDQQKEDIQRRFKNIENKIVTVPHAMEKKVALVEFEKRDKDKILALARLSSEKQLSHMIEIMSEVVKKFPNKKLFIYGEGGERNLLQKLIEEKNLESNVFLPGYTSDISSELNSSVLYLSTSCVESFSLGILEAISHGVPVISYDIKYGPSAFIKNNKNGFLVEKDNKKEFAEKVMYYFDHIEKEGELYTENSYQYAQNFNMDEVSLLWKKILFNLSSK